MWIEKTVVKTVALRTFDRAFKHQIQKAGIILNSHGKIQFMEDMVEISDECLMPLITKVKKLESQAQVALEMDLEMQPYSLDDCLSTLTELILPEQNIHGELNLLNFPELLFIDLSHNHISRIEALPPNLVAVCLAFNKLEVLPDISHIPIKHFDLSFNPISKIENLPSTLESLDLSYSNVSSFETIVESVPESCSTLMLKGSPLCLCPQYENYIFAKLPNLKKLDEVERPEELPDIASVDENLCLEIAISDFKCGQSTPDIMEEEKELKHEFYLQLSYRLPSGVVRLERLDWKKPDKVDFSMTHEIQVSPEWRDILTVSGVGIHIMGIHEVFDQSEESKLIRMEEKALANAQVLIKTGENEEAVEFLGCVNDFWDAEKMWQVRSDGEPDGSSIKFKYVLQLAKPLVDNNAEVET